MRITSKAIEESIDLDFKDEQEFWNIYPLSDGTILKVRLVLRGVKRLQKPKRDGSPQYIINSTNIARATNVPKELIKKR